MSVIVYNNSGGTFTRDGVSSGLNDFQIKPDPGTRNPFQRRTLRHGRFTLSIQRDVSGEQANVLPLVPSTPTKGDLLPPGFGFIIYRVYFPHGGDFNSVSLPTLVFSRHRSTQTLQRCTGTNPVVQRLAPKLKTLIEQHANSTSKFPPPSGQPAFAKPPSSVVNSLFPNVANAYVAATFYPTPGTVVVVQGKAPKFTPGMAALPWSNPPRFDLRYWSLCNNRNVSPYPVVLVQAPSNASIYGCAADLNTQLVDGQYTYVLSTLADRPSTATTANGFTWLPYSNETDPTVSDVLLFRNMLGDQFPNSIQNISDTSQAAAQATMGPYYPRAAKCSVSTFTQGGASACFAAAGASSS
jgi:hypothetical protein